MIAKKLVKLSNLLIGFCIFISVFSCKKDHSENNKKIDLPYYNQADFTPIWYTKQQLDTAHLHQIAAFNFIDQNGQSISNKSLKDKIYVANFFFTICPSICPSMTKNLLAVQEAFQKDERVVLLSHSVMPTTDSIAQLKKYAERWKIDNQKWHLLTGNKEEIYKLARQSYFAEKEIGLQKNKNDFLHTENVFLIDTKGHIRGVYNATLPLDIENLIKDIRVLL